MVVASHQEVTLSSEGRTALFIDGTYTYISDRGAYKLALLSVSDYASLTFGKSPNRTKLQPHSIGLLDVEFSGVIHAEELYLQGNEVVLQPGSTIQLSGGGSSAMEGPGAGKMVCIHNNTKYFISF